MAGAILIKKTGDGSKKFKGAWDSIHVVEVQEKVNSHVLPLLRCSLILQNFVDSLEFQKVLYDRNKIIIVGIVLCNLYHASQICSYNTFYMNFQS